MDGDDLLDLSHPPRPQTDIDLEARIKQSLRSMALNARVPREIERYSDKYIECMPYDQIMKTVNIELMSPELIRMFGAELSRDVDVIHPDSDDGSSEKREDRKSVV